jgi:hypothetical protein
VTREDLIEGFPLSYQIPIATTVDAQLINVVERFWAQALQWFGDLESGGTPLCRA